MNIRYLRSLREKKAPTIPGCAEAGCGDMLNYYSR